MLLTSINIIKLSQQDLSNSKQVLKLYIVDNLQIKINELLTGTTGIIGDMKKHLEQGRAVVVEMLKSISSLKPISSNLSTVSTTSPTMPQTLPTTQTIEPSSSSPFLEKQKEMPELKAKLL